MQTRAEEGGDGGEAKWWEEEEEEWQGMGGERGGGVGGERDSESGRESKPVLQCPIVDFLSFLLQFDANVSLACCQTTRRLEKTKVMKGFLTQFFLFLTTKTIIIFTSFFSSALRILGIQKRKIAMMAFFFFRT
jgi:hypothetical protein